MTHARPRRIAAVLGLLGLVVATSGAVLSLHDRASGATAGTVTVSPNTNVTTTATVSVSGSGLLRSDDSQPFSGTVALSLCGNADASGNALASISTSDCDGAAQVAHIVFGNVTAGSLPATNFTIRTTGIGSSNRQCLPVPPATLPCQIGVGDVGTSGTIVAVAGTFTLVPQAVTTTTTTTSSTTTTTSASSTTTTTAAPSTTTTVAPTTTTKPPATKTFTCTDIPIAPGALVLSQNRCLTDGQTIQVSAPPGAFPPGLAGSLFILECNPDPAIPTDGSGCNVGGLKIVPINADGSVPSTSVSVKLGKLGSNPAGICPPTQAQADTGVVNCIVVASLNGKQSDPTPITAAFTTQGQSVVLPVDASGNPSVPPTTTPAAAGGVQVGGAVFIAAPAASHTALAMTGPGALTWWLVVIGIALLDLGYLAVSATWTPRRRRRQA